MSDSTKLRLANYHTGVPGGFRWTVPETGTEIGPETNLFDLLKSIRLHYKSNEIEVPEDLDARVEDDICQQLEPGWCKRKDGQRPAFMHRWRKTINTVVSGTKSLAHWKRQYGGRSVDQATANKRAATCIQCPFNTQPDGCRPCNSPWIEHAIQAVIGYGTTKHDHGIKSCNICGCHLRAKVWMPTEALATNISTDKLTEYPEWCWIPKEIKQQNDQSTAH